MTAKRAGAAAAAIHRGDETGVPNRDRAGRSHAPEGQTPAVARTAERIARGMIPAASDRGPMRLTLRGGASNADRLVAFPRRLVGDAGRKVAPIVDDPKVREAGKVRARVASHVRETEPSHLPSRAPDHDPVGCLNDGLGRQPRQQPRSGSEQGLVGRTRSVLRAIPRSPERVRACSRPDPVRYAA